MLNDRTPENLDGVGRLFIISAPSGAGKTSLIKTVVEKTPNLMVSISPRHGLPVRAKRIN